MPDNGSFLPAGLVLQDRYVIQGMIAEGGMGAVYLAEVPSLGNKRVAIKEMRVHIRNPEERRQAVELFQAEAQILARLDHPGLVQVTDYFEHDDNVYLTMAYVDGVTLERRLQESTGVLDPDLVMGWMVQICDVLDYCHRQSPQVIVRDLKPENIMVDRNQHIRLVDFGLARLLEAGGDTKTLVKGAGTPGFAPVEQYAGVTDARSDIYSLGATIYRLLTRQTPPISVARLTENVQLPTVRSLNPAVDPRLQAVVEKMLAVYKDQRYESVAEVSVILDAILRSDSRRSTKPPPRTAEESRPVATWPSSPAVPPRQDAAPTTSTPTQMRPGESPSGLPPQEAACEPPQEARRELPQEARWDPPHDGRGESPQGTREASLPAGSSPRKPFRVDRKLLGRGAVAVCVVLAALLLWKNLGHLAPVESTPPTPSSAAPPTTSPLTLQVFANPGASVRLDGTAAGQVPANLARMQTGEHVVEVVKPGHRTFTCRFRLKAALSQEASPAVEILSELAAAGGTFSQEQDKARLYVRLESPPGKLVLDPSVRDCEINVDGEVILHAPTESKTLTLPAGPHAVKVFWPRTLRTDFTLEIVGGQEVVIRAQGGNKGLPDLAVEPESSVSRRVRIPLVSLTIVTTPPMATVRLDGHQLATSPVTVADLKPGRHDFQAAHPGYKDLAFTRTVPPGNSSISLKLEKSGVQASPAARPSRPAAPPVFPAPVRVAPPRRQTVSAPRPAPQGTTFRPSRPAPQATTFRPSRPAPQPTTFQPARPRPAPTVYRP